MTVKKEELAKKTKRHRLSLEEKKKILEESGQPGETISSVARKHHMAPSQLSSWKRQIENGSISKTQKIRPKGSPTGNTESIESLKNRISELERVLGKKTMELERLKEQIE